MFTIKEDIATWCDDNFISNYTIDDNLTVNVNSDVFLYLIPMETLPVQFGYISGEFLLGENGLTSLKGCPHTVEHDFTCGGNLISSLKYLPQTINGTIKLFNNIKLTDFTSNLKTCNNLIKSSNRIPGLSFLSFEDEIYSYDSLEYIKWNDNVIHFLEEDADFIMDEEEDIIYL